MSPTVGDGSPVEAYMLIVNNDQDNDYQSLRAALVWQYSQFGSGVRRRGASEPRRVFFKELHDFARYACSMLVVALFC